MSFVIGQIFEKGYPPEAAYWCSVNNAILRPYENGSFIIEQFLSEDEIIAKFLVQAKAERAAAVSAITVTVDGLVFDGDETAQDRMARTITAATATGASMTDTTTWVLHDNTVAQVSIQQLATALRLAGEAQTALWTVPYESAE